MKKVLFCCVSILTVLSLGLTLLHCGNGGDEPECAANADCTAEYGANAWCDLTVGECRCTPDCTNKCCGDDGCKGICEDNCTAPAVCNTDTCACEVDRECQNNQDCIDEFGANYWCDLTVYECKCTPDCTNKCCDDDGCGTACQDTCQSPAICNTQTCACEIACTQDSDCPTPATQCCKSNVCEDMNCTGLDCGLDPVCSKSCGECQAGEDCVNGKCKIIDVVLCPDTQECVDVTSGGMKGCLLPNTTVPPAAALCSEADPSCDGNFYCVQISVTDFFCIEHCGACPAGQACWTIGGDKRVCLTTAGEIPDGIPYCDDAVACTGNTLCIRNVNTGEWYGCVSLCSSEYGPCTENATKCDGDTVQTCTGGVWVDTTDCTLTSKVCFEGACMTLQSCNMVNGAGDCPLGEMCFPSDAACTVFNCYQAGTAPVGGTCASLRECAPGAICMSDNFCRLVCSATITCTAPETCQNITDCPTDFGICAPP